METEIKKTLCSICNPDSHCGIDAHVKDGKIIKIEGTKNNVHSQGILCAKGAANRQYVYSKDRILHPMKRVGEKGSGQFEKISWEEAYRIIAEKLKDTKEKYGAKSVCFFAGYPKWFRPLLFRLAAAFETPNYGTESSVCFRATQLSWKLLYGQGTAPDFQNSNLMIIWSKNPAHTQFYQSRLIYDALDKGMKLIVVDPRNTPMTERADVHLKLKPGTDGALALAMANIIIKENLYDREFVENYTYGFEEYRKYCETFTPEYAEEITGVPAENIIKAARLYAISKPASMMVSAAPVVHNVNGLQNYRAAMSLIGLTGNFDVKGGNVVTPFGYCYSSSFVKTNEHSYKGARYNKEKGVGEEEFPVWYELIQEEIQAARIPRYILGEGEYKLHSLVGFGLNYRMWPNSKKMLKALEEIDFFINTEVFMTDTCKYADIVLPACTSLERSEIKVYNEDYIFCSQQAIKPLGESKHDGQIILELAKALNIKDEKLNITYDEYMDYILEPTGASLEELRAHPEGMYAPIIQPYKEKGYMEKGFPTPTGKMEFYSTVLEKYKDSHGYNPLPEYKDFFQIFKNIDREKYPFIMNTGARKPHMVHSRAYRIPWLNNLEDMSKAEIYKDDADRLHIKENDEIIIKTPIGEIEAKAKITLTTVKGAVFMYHDNPERDVNILISDDYLDPISGFPSYKGYPCNIEKKGD